MIRKVIGAVLMALILAGAGAAEVAAQASGTQQKQPTRPAQPKVKPAKSAPATSNAEASSLEYPPCSKIVTDHCIQLWQRDLDRAYPQCAKLRGGADKAACIEGAKTP